MLKLEAMLGLRSKAKSILAALTLESDLVGSAKIVRICSR